MASTSSWRSPPGTPQTPRQFPRPSNSTPRNNSQSTQALDEGRRIYVGNMPYTAKPEDVQKLFEDGEYTVERVDMAVDPFTGRNPSYCFVELGTKEQAERAMTEINGKELMGRPVKVNECVQKNQSQRNTPVRTSNHTQSPSFDRWAKRDAPETPSTPKTTEQWEYSENGKRLYIGGLSKPESQESGEAEIRALFEGFNIEAISKVISSQDKTGLKPGEYHYAFVDLSTSEEADAAAIAINGKETPEGLLKVKKAINRGPKKASETQEQGQAPAQASPQPKPPRAREWETKTSWR